MKHIIVGFGNVGQSIFNKFISIEDEYTIIDSKYTNDFELIYSIDKCDIIWINLPDDKVNFINIIEKLNKESNKFDLCVITSTMLPNIEKYFDKKLSFKIIRLPIFENERNMINDILKNDKLVIGGNIIALKKFEQLYPNYQYFRTSFKNACLFKYVYNLYSAYNILFWNFVYELSNFQNTDYRIFEEMFQYLDKPIINSKVALDGKLGFGGYCLPKDLNIFRDFFEHDLLSFMKSYNKKLRNNEQT